MNIDVKLESQKISREICSGSVEQACEDYKNILGNYHFFTDAPLERSMLNNFGVSLSKHVRKHPINFLQFCQRIWYDTTEDNREPIGPILAALEQLDPEKTIRTIITMCRDAESIEDVDIMVIGFESVIVRNPIPYFPLLAEYITNENIWIKRLIIVTIGHIMQRHKTTETTRQCLELLRPVITYKNKYIQNTTRWIIGCFGVRADQRAIADFVETYADSEDPVVIGNFTEALKRSKIAIQKDICETLIPVFEHWSHSQNAEIRKSAQCALRILQ
jgi:hypothetical protein